MVKEKIYFIRDVEKILHVNRKTLFYWEKTKKVPKAKRTPMGNYRYWADKDIEILKKLISK